MQAILMDVHRPARDVLQLFEGKQSALLHEAMGKRGALTADFRPVYPGARLTGSALTVKASAGDNLMLHKAISIAQPGDVLLAAVEGYTEGGHWGEIAATAAIQRGVRGLVIDGGVRDVEALAALGFPVFARSVSIKGTAKRRAGLINHPIVIGGVYVRPGDIVVADADGVVIVPQEEHAAVLESAAAIEAHEQELLRRIRQGELTIDLLNLRPALRELGIDGDAPS